VTNERNHPDHKPTTAEAAAAGEDDAWQVDRTVDPDDRQRIFDDPEAEEDEERELI
jgi:hypothetical protein